MVKNWRDKTLEEKKLHACTEIMKSDGFFVGTFDSNYNIVTMSGTDELKMGAAMSLLSMTHGDALNELLKGLKDN